MWSNLLIDLLHIQGLCSGIEFSQSALVSRVFSVEVVFLGGDEALGTTAGVGGLADRAGPGGGWFVGSSLRITRSVVGAADAVVRTYRKEHGQLQRRINDSSRVKKRRWQIT